ncbi:hypothetical protein [Mesorhizobium sp.]|uniref:hypothetical protein n=1 Tax=Mesorhizobium sp. TaxID=1871066 RepID=UPI00338FD741
MTARVGTHVIHEIFSAQELWFGFWQQTSPISVVPGLTVTAEVDYDHYGNFGGVTANPANVNWTNADKKNSVGGILFSNPH